MGGLLMRSPVERDPQRDDSAPAVAVGGAGRTTVRGRDGFDDREADACLLYTSDAADE